MSFLKKLFGGGSGGAGKPHATETHEGYTIHTTPMPEGGQYRLAAIIEKTVDGELKQHRLIRADMLMSEEDASQAAIRKAKQVIAEQGDRLFD